MMEAFDRPFAEQREEDHRSGSARHNQKNGAWRPNAAAMAEAYEKMSRAERDSYWQAWIRSGEAQGAFDLPMPISSLAATPLDWIDPRAIPPRAWVYGRHYARKFLSTTTAIGGIGKSSLTMTEVIAIATGRSLLGIRPDEQTNVWIWNGEDPVEELQRRIAAICLHYEIGQRDMAGCVYVDSGRTSKITIAETTRAGTVIARPIVEAITRTIRANDIGVMLVDPFVSSHAVPENDNTAIEIVAATWARIADETGCSIELVHHSRKTGGVEVTVEDTRGAGALLAKARSARVLNGMTKDEAERADVENKRLFFRVENGKANLAVPADKADWYRLASVDLGNGPTSAGGAGGDSVGVVTTWEWPDALEGISVESLREVQRIVANGQWRENVQASNWVGKAVADVLHLDVGNKAHKTKIAGLLKIWIANGMFQVVSGKDAKGNERPFVEVGERA